MPFETFWLRYFVVPIFSIMSKFIEHTIKRCDLDNWETALFQLVKTGKFIFALPFEVNKSSGLLRQASKTQIQIWHFLATLYIFDLIYMSTVAKNVNLDNVSVTEFANFYMHYLSRSIAGVVLLVIAHRKQNLIEFNNAIILYRRRLQGIVIRILNNAFKF